MTAFHGLLINPDSIPITRLLLGIPCAFKSLFKHHLACLQCVLLISFYEYYANKLSGTVGNRKSVEAFQGVQSSFGNLFGLGSEETWVCSLFH